MVFIAEKDRRAGVRIGSPQSNVPTQRPAWLPRILEEVNRPAVERLTPTLTEISPQERIKMAINTFEDLTQAEPDLRLKPSRKWSLEYFRACAQGPEARRDFLIGEGVFWGNGDYLIRPDAVHPQMEIANFKPEDYPEELQDDMRELLVLMFEEYFAVKNLLSPLNFSNLWVRLGLPSLEKFPITQPRLGLSFLLKDYVYLTMQEARTVQGPPLIAIFGPGKGEELVPLIDGRLSVLCFDAHPLEVQQELIGITFRQARRQLPSIVDVSQDPNKLDHWKKEDCPPTIFTCPEIDFSKQGAIPEHLAKTSLVSACAYVLHEIVDDDSKARLARNMTQVSRGSVVAVDGLNSTQAFDNVILPLSDTGPQMNGQRNKGTPITGHDAVITHLLCTPPDRLEETLNNAKTGLNWSSRILKLPPPPLLHPLQVAAIGK